MDNMVGHGESEDGFGDSSEEVVPWTKEQVQALRSKHPPLSPWRIVAAQAVAGMVMTGLWFGLGREGAPGWSAFSAALAVVVPGALMARGLSRLSVAAPGAIALGFMVWELLKIVLAVAILVAAVRVVPGVNWWALLSTLVVCLKMSWLVLLRRGR